MKHLLYVTLPLVILTIASLANLNAQNIEGEWEFSVPQAPWEYNKGVIQISQEPDEELSGTVHFHTGSSIPLQEIAIDQATVIFHVFVDGYKVRVAGTLAENQLAGRVHSPEGDMDFSAVRKAESGE